MAAVKATAEAIGVDRMAHGWGDASDMTVHIDSSAAIGVVNRRGSGKLRHIRVGQLWIQEMAEEGEVKVRKIGGEQNVADLMTKHLADRKVSQFIENMNCEARSGRADIGLQITS